MMSAQRKSLIVVAQNAAPVLVFLAATIFSGCASRRIAKDYVFGVTGIVTTEDGTPVQGADVTLQVNGLVYEGVDPVKIRHIETNDTGGFVFGYIANEPGGKYTITVRKQGFESEIVSGAAPPTGNHVIKLKKPIKTARNDVTSGPILSHYSLPTAHYLLSCHV